MHVQYINTTMRLFGNRSRTTIISAFTNFTSVSIQESFSATSLSLVYRVAVTLHLVVTFSLSVFVSSLSLDLKKNWTLTKVPSSLWVLVL